MERAGDKGGSIVGVVSRNFIIRKRESNVTLSRHERVIEKKKRGGGRDGNHNYLQWTVVHHFSDVFGLRVFPKHRSFSISELFSNKPFFLH